MIVRFIIAFACVAAFCWPAAAIVGGGQQVAVEGRPIVMLLGTRGGSAVLCTGTALARDLLLTAAHCATPETRLQMMSSSSSGMKPIGAVARHPSFDAQSYSRGRVAADVALVKLIAPLPDYIGTVAMADKGETVSPGDRLVIAGFGMTTVGKDATTGIAHMAALIVTGRPGNLQIRMVDPTTRGASFGLGACTGDSGGPVFRETGGGLRVLGVISWSTGPADEEGCGGMTGATPLTLYRPWIVEQAAKWGAFLK